jgi:Major Facilitator Superfamily
MKIAQQHGRGQHRPITSTRSALRPGCTDAAARSSACSSSRACGRNAWPWVVSWTPRAVRASNRTPRSFSSAAIRLDTACWVRDRSAAASENWPASVTATTVLADAVSYLLSAAGIRAIGGREPQPSRPGARRPRAGDLLDGWRYILAHPALRPLFFNVLLVSGLIMATEPLIAILMLGRLGFRPWQYGLAFAAPCVGGVLGSRLARHLAGRFGRHPVLFAAGILRTCWLLGLAFVRPGAAGLVLVIAVQFGLVTCCGVFNPMLAAHRLGQTTPERVVRTLAAWSVSSSLTIAALTAPWGRWRLSSAHAARSVSPVSSSWARRCCYRAATARPRRRHRPER